MVSYNARSTRIHITHVIYIFHSYRTLWYVFTRRRGCNYIALARVLEKKTKQQLFSPFRYSKSYGVRERSEFDFVVRTLLADVQIRGE